MKVLLQAEGALTPVCAKSHIIYAIDLDREISQLWIDFSYSPKCLDDRDTARSMIMAALHRDLLEEQQQSLAAHWEDFLPFKNLLTLSFDDAAGFRGCAHRHDPRQHLELATHRASPGLLAGPVPPGQFRITLSVHALITNTCRYSLRVWEGDEGKRAALDPL
jgi:hypothetical protein